MARKRRTKKQYTDLYDDPTILFKGCEVILFPNGANEIWIRSADARRSIRITAGDGPAGLGLTITKGAFGQPITVTGNLAGDYEPAPVLDMAEVTACVYRTDSWSQKFKAWYGSRDKEANPHPGDAPEGPR